MTKSHNILQKMHKTVNLSEKKSQHSLEKTQKSKFRLQKVTT